MGREWYDFVVVKIGENHLPAKVLGFVDYHGEALFVVRHVPVPSHPTNFYYELKQSFTRRFRLGGVDCIAMVNVESLIEPLLVFPDFGSSSTNDFHALLPKRHWVHTSATTSRMLSTTKETKYSFDCSLP